VRAGERVLALGGLGARVLAWIERCGASCVGLDISPRWVAAQNAAARARSVETTWVVGDATALPFPDRCFAAVVAFDVLEHVDELERAVSEIYRVLRPGGRLLVHMPVQDIEGSLDGFSRARDPADFAARQASVGHYHERMPTRAKMRVLLEHVRFQVLDVRPFNVWIQPAHDHRVLPALAGLRHRKGASERAGAAPRQGASAWQRAYATTVVPVFRALASLDHLGARLGIGGSAFFLAERPAEREDPLRARA
jgi:SAM-dependent methyltransferase